jgi:hypothetical protein
VLRGDAKAVAQQLAAVLPGKLKRERFAQWADGLRQQVRYTSDFGSAQQRVPGAPELCSMWSCARSEPEPQQLVP